MKLHVMLSPIIAGYITSPVCASRTIAVLHVNDQSLKHPPYPEMTTHMLHIAVFTQC